MLLIVLVTLLAVFLAWRPLQRAIPFESLLAFGLTGAIMAGLLATGRIG